MAQKECGEGRRKRGKGVIRKGKDNKGVIRKEELVVWSRSGTEMPVGEIQDYGCRM